MRVHGWSGGTPDLRALGSASRLPPYRASPARNSPTMKSLLREEPALARVRGLAERAQGIARFAQAMTDEVAVRYLTPVPDWTVPLCRKNYRAHG